jgi:hypothetical protein
VGALDQVWFQLAGGDSWHQHIAEFYSPRRLLPEAWERGLSGIFSLDLNTGWDFTRQHAQDMSINLLVIFCVIFLMLSPPCTSFSSLMHMWNYPKMNPEKASEMWALGMRFLEHSMRAAAVQVEGGRFFAFEHPASASSWKQVCTQTVKAMPGVQTVEFDQCMLGLVSKVTRTPMKKRTRVMTNCPMLVDMLRPFQCDRSHVHEKIQGSEGGCKRSVWAQFYPAPFVKVLVDAAYRVHM